eukprot:364177-Chlamydomonas_euryale.AAC.4
MPPHLPTASSCHVDPLLPAYVFTLVTLIPSQLPAFLLCTPIPAGAAPPLNLPSAHAALSALVSRVCRDVRCVCVCTKYCAVWEDGERLAAREVWRSGRCGGMGGVGAVGGGAVHVRVHKVLRGVG